MKRIFWKVVMNIAFIMALMIAAEELENAYDYDRYCNPELRFLTMKEWFELDFMRDKFKFI